MKTIVEVVGTLEMGGIERMVTDISIRLKKAQDYQPVIVCLYGKKGSYIKLIEGNGIPIEECLLSKSNIWSFPLRFSKILRKHNPDIVHSHVDFSIPFQIIGCKLTRIKNVVITQHSEYQYSALGRLRAFMYYQLFKNDILAYTAVSQKVALYLSNLHKMAEKDIYVIRNAIDTNRFFPDSNKRTTMRKLLGINENVFLVGYVGRLIHDKGFDTMLKIAKMIAKKDSCCHFVVIGDGPERPKVEFEASNSKNLTFLGIKPDIENYYNAMDCLLQPSRREGLPLSTIEALSCGVVVIGSRIGGIPEALDNGKCGMLVQDAEIDSFVQGIEKLKREREFRETLQNNAIKWIRQNFTLEKCVQDYVSLFDSILEEKKSKYL